MRDFSFENIDTSLSCYNQFTRFYYEAKDLHFENISIHLKKWFGANMCAVLGGLLDKIGATNSVRIDSTNAKTLRILKKNTFLASFGFPVEYDEYDTTCRYQKLLPSQSMFFNSYIANELLGKQTFPEMTKLLKEKIAESIYEIFVNAQMHSGTEYIYTCGQFYPNKHKIEFTVVDTGVGFKDNVNKRFGAKLNSLQAIKWAVKDMNTTKRDAPGGIGLAILNEFIKMNGGKFQIVSGDAFFQVGNVEQFDFLEKPFPGTVVNMEFRTDDKNSYCFKNEINLDEIF